MKEKNGEIVTGYIMQPSEEYNRKYVLGRLTKTYERENVASYKGVDMQGSVHSLCFTSSECMVKCLEFFFIS